MSRALEPSLSRRATSPLLEAGKARPDGPTGGRLVIRKGAERDVSFYAKLKEPRQASDDALASQRPSGKRRRCLLCRRPILFLGAPILLVAFFALRIQRGGGGTGFGSLGGYTAVLVAQANGAETCVTVVIRPASGLTSLLLRQRRVEPGSPMEVVLSTDDPARLPMLLYGETPGPGLPDTVLEARFAAGSGAPRAIRADVSIGGQTVSLVGAVEGEAISRPR